MPVAIDAQPQNEVEIHGFRKHDFEDLEAWAAEMGVSTDELASQIVRKATQFLSQRKENPRNNVVPIRRR